MPAERDLFDTRPAQAVPWPQLRERLRARLGDEAVHRVAPSGDPRPERAWRRAGVDDDAVCAAPAPVRTDRELDDIDAFFSTESGLSYARKSFAMSSDPRIIAASMESLPTIMGSLGEFETDLAAAAADLPEPRTFAELSAEERARLAELLGWSVEELEANMHRSSEQEENIDWEE